MSTPTFTPGPWRVNGMQSIRGPAGEYIARANWKNGAANALLIASAPDLYAALHGTMDWLASYPGFGSEQAWLKAHAALAKARGDA